MTFVAAILSEWPRRQLDLNGLPHLSLLNVEAALIAVLPEWVRLFTFPNQ